MNGQTAWANVNQCKHTDLVGVQFERRVPSDRSGSYAARGKNVGKKIEKQNKRDEDFFSFANNRKCLRYVCVFFDILKNTGGKLRVEICGREMRSNNRD